MKSIESSGNNPESSLSFEQTEKLEKIDEVLKTAEQEVATEESERQQAIEAKSPGWWERNKDRVRKAVLMATVSLGSLIAVGCDKSQSPSTPEKSAQSTEQNENADHRVHTQEEEKQALQHAFQMIAGDAIAQMPDGNLVLHTGGADYYELQNSDLETLMKGTDSYLDMVAGSAEQDPQIKARVSIEFDKTLEMKITSQIMELGKKVPEDELPDKLKEIEQGRQQTTEEMSK